MRIISVVIMEIRMKDYGDRFYIYIYIYIPYIPYFIDIGVNKKRAHF